MTALLALVSALVVVLAVLTSGWFLLVLAFSVPATLGLGWVSATRNCLRRSMAGTTRILVEAWPAGRRESGLTGKGRCRPGRGPRR